MLVNTGSLAVADLADEATSLGPGLPSRVIARINENQLRLSVYAGEGNWHSHPTADELFLVLDGELTLDLEDGTAVTIGPRQVVTIPAGTVHRPRASVASTILCFKHADATNQFFDPPPATSRD